MENQRNQLLEDTGPADEEATSKDQATTISKPLVFKATLLLIQDESTIGPTGLLGMNCEERLFTSTKVAVEVVPNWTSSIRFEIKLIRVIQNPTEGAGPSPEILHSWIFWLNSDNAILLEESLFVYGYHPNAPSRAVRDRHFEDLYSILQQDDKYAVMARKNGQLRLLQLKFRPAKAQTQSILVKTPAYLDGVHRLMHEQFRALFSSAEDKVVTLDAFIAVFDRKNEIFAELLEFKNAIKMELAHNPIDQFYLKSKHHKRKIDTQCMTKREARPQPIVPLRSTFRNAEEFFTIEGFAVQQAEEHEKDLCQAATSVECEVRVLQFSGGSDKVYVAFVHLGEPFDYHLSNTDSFTVTFKQDPPNKPFSWNGQILDDNFSHAAPCDILILLFRGLDEETGWDNSMLKSVLDCRTKISGQIPSDYCCTGEPNLATIKPQRSKKPYKSVLRSLRKLNPAHASDINYGEFHCAHWDKILLGQNLLMVPDTTIDLFSGLDVGNLLKEWEITVDEAQHHALVVYFRTMPHRLGMGTGCVGSGKTMLDILVCMLLIYSGKKVDIFAPNNTQADSFLLKLQAQMQRLEDKGKPITDKKLVRFHSPATEKRVVQSNNMKHNETPWKKERHWQAEEVSTFMYDRALHTLTASHYDALGEIGDRRYKLDALSLGTLLLKTTNALDRPKPLIFAAEDGPSEDSSPEDIVDPVDAGEEADTASQVGSIHSEDLIGLDEPRVNSPNQQRKRLAELTRIRQNPEIGMTERERLINSFNHYFLKQENEGSLSVEENEMLTNLGNELVQDILDNDVCCVSTTIINAGDKRIEKRAADHRIVQGAFRLTNGEIYVAFAHTPVHGTIHISGDPLQIAKDKEQVKHNNFANYANFGVFERLLGLGYPAYELTIQHRIIPVLSDIVSKVFYRGQMRSAVDIQTRPYAQIAQGVLEGFCGVKHPIVFLNVSGQAHRVGLNRSKVNPTEASVAHALVERYIQAGIPPCKIAVISGYQGHRKHVANLQAFHPDVKMREHINMTADQISGEEVVAVVFCFVGDDKIGHMKERGRLLVSLSRGMDSFVGIVNWSALQSENARSLSVLKNLRREFDAIGAWVDDFTL